MVAFTLPEGWQCAFKDDHYWLCHKGDPSKAPGKTKPQAFLVHYGKRLGEKESLETYGSYLNQPIVRTWNGKLFKSRLLFARKLKKDYTDWLDSLHLESELPGYYTREYVTLRHGMAIVLSFCVAHKSYEAHALQIQELMDSVRILYKGQRLVAKDFSSSKKQDALLHAQEGKFHPGKSIFSFESEEDSHRLRNAMPKKVSFWVKMTLLLAGVMVMVGYWIWRKKRLDKDFK